VNPALAGVALAVVVGAVIAGSARNARTAIFGLVITMVGVPLLADPIAAPLPLAARLVAAVLAGYKDSLKSAARLMSLGKITSAINGLKDAEAIRRQAVAVSQEPAIPFVNAPVRPNIQKASGARERTTWSADITDLQALHEAALRGEVPPDVLMVDVARVNRYATELRELINTWPGVQARKTTTTF